MTDLPDWMRPPREEGWFAEDLDRLPQAPRHTELIDGALAFTRHYWLVEGEAVGPVVHVHELDEPTKACVPTGLFRDSPHVTVPFEIDIDLAELVPGR
ncbi:hypothetical protein AB0H12_19915 [Actinosynnema sp. NPDC023794]